MVIYAEYLFVENFITGAMILILTGKILGILIKKIPLAFGSILCGAYSFILFIETLSPWIVLLSKLGFSIILVLLVFQTKSIRILIRTVMIFYLVSFAMGGVTIGAMYFIGLSGITHNSAVYLDSITYFNIALGCILTYIIFNSLAGFLKVRLIREKTTTEVLIELEDKKTEVRGLVDTGNFLTDPLTGKPVIIISKEAAKNILPLDIVDLAVNEANNNIAYEKLMKSDYANRIRFIPYKSFGEGKGVLIGVRPDKVRIELKGSKKNKNFITIPDGIILAIYKGFFLGEGAEERYSVLLHPSAMEGGIACNV